MKTLLWNVICACMAITVLCISEEHQKIRDSRNKAIEECRKEKPGVSEEDFSIVRKKNEEPSNENQHCVLDCVYGKMGILKNGKVNVDEVNRAMKVMLGGDEALYRKVNEAHLACQKEIENKYDTIGKCQVASVYHTCIKKKMT